MKYLLKNKDKVVLEFEVSIKESFIESSEIVKSKSKIRKQR